MLYFSEWVALDVTQRIDWLDYGKGIGIILVVYAHLLSSGYHAGLPVQAHFFSLSDSLIYSFHMPLFFFLAGWLVEQSYEKRGARGFLASKIRLILYPYLIWSFLQSGVEFVLAQHSQRGITASELLSIPYFPVSQFWYLYALLWMYVVYAIGRKLGVVAYPGMILGSCYLFSFPLQTEVLALHGFSTGFLFFVLAVMIKKNMGELGEKNLSTWVSIVFFLIFMAVGLYVFEERIEPTRLTNGSHPVYFLFLAVVGITFCIGLAQMLARRRCCRFVSILGRYSLQIYLVHMLAGVGARVVLLNVFHINNLAVHLVCGVGAGLFVPVLFYNVLLQVNFPYFFEPSWGRARGSQDNDIR